MDLSKLRYFVAVAERLSFTAAAEALCISQSTVSRHVADFEVEVGRQLLFRTKRTVKLTPAGSLMLREAYAIQALVEEAVNRVREVDLGPVGKLHLGMLGAPGQKIAPQLTRRFHLRQPGIELEFQRLSWRQVNEYLHRGRIDIAFTLSLGLEHFPDFQWENLGTDQLAVVVSADHPLANESLISFARLEHEDFVLPSRLEAPAGSDWFAGLCAKAGFKPKVVAEPDLETVLMMVEAGLGISVLAGHVAQAASPNLRFIPIDDAASSTDLVVAWNRATTNPAVPLFLEEVRLFKQEHPSRHLMA